MNVRSDKPSGVHAGAARDSQTHSIVTVLIVGAGPTGLTLACGCARNGISFRLIDASPEPQAGSRGKGVQPRTLEVFDNLGIVDRVIANGWIGMPIRSIGPDGQVRSSGTETVGPTPDIPFPTSLITPEWRIEEALRLRLVELGGVVEFGASLRFFVQNDEAVSAMVVRPGETGTITARWLVGCDGGHSTVRKQAGIAFDGETRDDVRMIVADVQVDGIHRDAWHMWWHEDGFVSLCPMPSTDIYQYQAAVAPGQAPEPCLANMQAILDRRSGRLDIRLSDPKWSSLWRANVRLARRYRERRVFLAGDAAHIHSPAGGQGMNTGIQDAHNLGWKLAAVAKGAAPALLDSYETERRPAAAGVLGFSDKRLAQILEQKVIINRRDVITTQLGVSYRWSALVRDDRSAAALLRAGDRAPDATGLLKLEGTYRLFDLMRGGHFTLLNFGATVAVGTFPSDVKHFQVVEQVIGTNDIADSEGHLVRAYEATGRTLVLVRPDGHIALISDAGDTSIVLSHLDAMGIPNAGR